MTRLRCDVCGILPSARRAVLAFNLRRWERSTKVTRGLGRIYLCEDCWSRTAGRRRGRVWRRSHADAVRAGRARWERMTPDQQREHIAMMLAARYRKAAAA